MTISATLLPEFDHEMSGVRKTLERVPDSKFDWAPHPKSMPLGRLTAHLAEIPKWATVTLTTDSLDFNPPGGKAEAPLVVHSREEALEKFDQYVREARAAIEQTDDATYIKPWSLLNSGSVLFTMPKIATLRAFVISHAIHHRAQLGLYLRMNDIPVPSIYGPSADEATF